MPHSDIICRSLPSIMLTKTRSVGLGGSECIASPSRKHILLFWAELPHGLQTFLRDAFVSLPAYLHIQASCCSTLMVCHYCLLHQVPSCLLYGSRFPSFRQEQCSWTHQSCCRLPMNFALSTTIKEAPIRVPAWNIKVMLSLRRTYS